MNLQEPHPKYPTNLMDNDLYLDTLGKVIGNDIYCFQVNEDNNKYIAILFWTNT